MSKDTRFIGAHVKAVSAPGEAAPDAPYGWVEGIANAFEVDRYGDLVLPSALAGAIEKFMLNPVLSFGHGIDGNPTNGTLPAGTVLSIKQDPKGNTTFRARFANTADAQKVRQLYADGDMRAFSIHFLPYGSSLEVRPPTPEELQQFPGTERVISKMELIEIACAVVPVNAGSLASGAKSLNHGKGKMSPMPTLKQGAKAMAKTILTSESRKAIANAAGAYDKHVKSMEGLKDQLEELSESPEGAEDDHPGMASKCSKAFQAATESHGQLGEAIKAMHVSINGGNEPASDGDEDPDAEPGDDADAGAAGGEAVTDGGTPPLPEDPEAKALVSAFRAGLAKK